MAHILETGFEYMDITNSSGAPAVRGYNIINGHIQASASGNTFQSTNPARLDDILGEFPLSNKEDIDAALKLQQTHFQVGPQHQRQPEVKS